MYYKNKHSYHYLPRISNLKKIISSRQENDHLREREVLAYCIQAAATLLQLVVIGFASCYAISQWKSDNLISVQERWNTKEMQIHRDRVTDALLCTKLKIMQLIIDSKSNYNEIKMKEFSYPSKYISDESDEIEIFDKISQDLNESVRKPNSSRTSGLTSLEVIARISARPRIGYQGLIETAYAFHDFASYLDGCMKIKACVAKDVCNAYGPWLGAYDKVFEGIYRDYRAVVNDKTWGDDIKEFSKNCSENNVDVYDRYQLNHSSEERKIDIKGKSNISVIDLNESEPSLHIGASIFGLKDRSCKRMSKTAAEEIADAN